MKLHLRVVILLFTFQIVIAQEKAVTLSGKVIDKSTGQQTAFATIVIRNIASDSSQVTGTLTDQEGRFNVELRPGSYLMEASFMGYGKVKRSLQVGRLSDFLDIGVIELSELSIQLNDVVINPEAETVSDLLEKKTFNIAGDVNKTGGTVMQSLQFIPGVSFEQDGTILLRGSSRVVLLLDGRQSAVTGFGNQAGLSSIPASAVEKIEVINNPNSTYDANGMAGIINIILKKESNEGINGNVIAVGGLGALVKKHSDLPTIGAQYRNTPKGNFSAGINHRSRKSNAFFQTDLFSQHRLNKLEFIDRIYENGNHLRHEYQENRKQSSWLSRAGIDYDLNAQNALSVSFLFNREFHVDRGSLPYFNILTNERFRLWEFYETELNRAVTSTVSFHHKFEQPGHQISLDINYTFQREDEIYNITNTLLTSSGQDHFKLIADVVVVDATIDYSKPLPRGYLKSGIKLRHRKIDSNMEFTPGMNSPMDIDADGFAIYDELIPSLYANYTYEISKLEIETGLRFELVDLDYLVDPMHNTYKSDGYSYFQPFPNIRVTYLLNSSSTFSIFLNRRVDRPDEGDLRIFPKYDDPEILKIGNPTLQPQFTNSIEVGFKRSMNNGFIYGGVFHKMTSDVITRITTQTRTGSNIYAVTQNAGDASNNGIEFQYETGSINRLKFSLAASAFLNTISDFVIVNEYPEPVTLSQPSTHYYSGNAKLNSTWRATKNLEFQVSAVYLGPDIFPQGRIKSRLAVDLGAKKSIQKGKGELTFNATDILGSMIIARKIENPVYTIESTDYFETQVVRIGYRFKF